MYTLASNKEDYDKVMEEVKRIAAQIKMNAGSTQEQAVQVEKMLHKEVKYGEFMQKGAYNALIEKKQYVRDMRVLFNSLWKNCKYFVLLEVGIMVRMDTIGMKYT